MKNFASANFHLLIYLNHFKCHINYFSCSMLIYEEHKKILLHGAEIADQQTL